jgi:hypothetical protein
MDIQDRFFGRGTSAPGVPVANPKLDDPPGLVLLFPAPPGLDAGAIAASLREYHPELAAVTVELQQLPPQPGQPPATIGLIAWGPHVVKLVVADTRAPEPVIEQCVQPAHYDPAIKEQAYRHAAHVRLFYAGYEPDRLERHVARAAAAAGLVPLGAVAVLNEAGRTSVPAVALLPHPDDPGDTMQTLRSFPIPLLYAGFVKLEVEGESGVWMRTYGCSAVGLPDFSLRAEAHSQGSAVFNLFANMLAHLRETGEKFAAGDSLSVGEGMYLRLRSPNPAEWFLESDGRMLVAEPITAEEAKA